MIYLSLLIRNYREIIKMPYVGLYLAAVAAYFYFYGGCPAPSDGTEESSETGTSTTVTDSYSTDNGKTLQTLRSGTTTN